MSGSIQVYYGGGRGKSTAALGRALRAASADGMTVFVIQFMKMRTEAEQEYLKRLEPEIKFFRFEKSEENFTDLSREEQLEEVQNIKNGLNFAKKVLAIDECNMLILDEVLGLVDNGVISEQDLLQLIEGKSEDTEMILTGRVMLDGLRDHVDAIYNIQAEK